MEKDTRSKAQLLAEIERLQVNEERYLAVTRGFDGIIYTCSRDFRIEYMNATGIERTGRDPTGEFCYKALHDRDSVCSWCTNDRVFRGETVQWEVQSPKDNRWYYVFSFPVYHPDGSISKQGMIQDITQRKESEDLLVRSEERYRRLYECLHDPFAKVNMSGRSRNATIFSVR